VADDETAGAISAGPPSPDEMHDGEPERRDGRGPSDDAGADDGTASGDDADEATGPDPRDLDSPVGGLGDTPPDRGPREMTDRRAVAVGVLVIVVGGTLGLVAPLVGQVAASLAGGLVAGYLAGPPVTRGGWNGLLAGVVSGLAFTVVLVVLAVGLDAFAGAPGGGNVAGVLLVGVVSTAVFAIVSSATGMAGAWYRG
jgi:hypothetical protein